MSSLGAVEQGYEGHVAKHSYFTLRVIMNLPCPILNERLSIVIQKVPTNRSC